MDRFKEEFKRFKKKSADLSGVLDLRNPDPCFEVSCERAASLQKVNVCVFPEVRNRKTPPSFP